jgi:hypothetical protein
MKKRVAVFATGAGAGVGYGAVSATGMTAAGIVGGGAGFGCPAGPLGAAAGAILGLAVLGVYSIFKRW